MINDKVFSSKEDEGWDRLVALNEKTGWFKVLGRAPKLNHFDASAQTGSRKFAIEIKTRDMTLSDDGGVVGLSNGKPFTGRTLYIEDHKLVELLLDAVVEGWTPLYVNFLKDGHVVIFNLLSLKKKPMVTKRMGMLSNGYGAVEMSARKGLWLEDAYIL